MSQQKASSDRAYEGEDHHGGSTRKSAASAKPKTKAASSVTIKKAGLTAEQRKAKEKQARNAARDEKRRLDRLYYKPDTERYRKLRIGWWVCLVGAVASTAVAWFTREIDGTLSTVFMVLAYALIIAAFWLDFSKIRKERIAYQKRMVALEEQRKKEERQAARVARSSNKKKGSGKNASRNPKVQAKIAAEKAAGSEAAEDAAVKGVTAEGGVLDEATGADASEEKPAKKGLFGFGKKKAE